MLKNYLKTALRNIGRNKVYSVINLAGLAVGMAVCVIIFIWAQFETGYERFHKHKNSLYRINTEYRMPDGQSGIHSSSLYPLAKLIKSRCSQIADVTRYASENNIPVKYLDKTITENRFGFADTSFFQMFGFHLIKGDPVTALKSRFSAVITESTAERLFGEEEPVGKTLTVAGSIDVIVTGVMKQPPVQTDFKFDILLPFLLSQGPNWDGGENVWGFNPLETYVRIHDHADPAETGKMISDLVVTSTPLNQKGKFNFLLQPVTQMHLYEPGGGGRITYILIFAAVGLAVLLIACFNFINLATAMTVRRIREIGLRKVIGASRIHIIRQFLGETLLYTLIAFALAMIMVQIVFPAFRQFIEAPPGMDISFSIEAMSGLAVIVLCTALLSGGYPAFALSAHRITDSLKKAVTGGTAFRKAILVFQFTLSTILIIGAIIIYRQLDFVRSKDMGFDKENLLMLPADKKINRNYETIRTELLRHPGITHVSRGLQNPGTLSSSVSGKGLDWEGKNPQTDAMMNFEFVDYDYIETMKMEMVKGRSFSRSFASDSTAFIVNEKAAAMMGISDPVGKQIRVMRQSGIMVGIVKDFHFMPFRVSISPLIIGLNPKWVGNIFIRFNPGLYAEAKTHMEKVFHKINPDYTFNPVEVSGYLNRLYGAEEKLGGGILMFTLLAVFIAALGLLGLCAYITEQRTKEIGIRKILGASIPRIAALISKEFLKWVLVANVFAWPIAYYFMSQWLGNYAYQTNLGIGIFLLSGLMTLGIAITVIGGQVFRAATANPVKSLRYE